MEIIRSTMKFCSKHRFFVAYGAGCALGLLLSRQNYFKKFLVPTENIYPTYELRSMSNLNSTCRACLYLKRVCPRGERGCSYAILCWVIELLDSAKETIDAAIGLMTLTEFKDAFVNAHRRGVKVRFISDAVMSRRMGSAIPRLRQSGVEVRTAPLEEHHVMHRRSVVVDNKWLLSGTANWTMQALCGNWETFTKTNDIRVVTSFVEAFEVEWELLSPPLPTPTST